MLIALPFLIASFFFTFGGNPIGEIHIVKYMVPFGYYQGGWLAVYLFCGWLFSREVTGKFGVPAGLLVFYLIFHGIWTSFWWRNGMEAVDGVQQLGIRWQSATSLFGMLLVLGPFVARKYNREDLVDLGGMLSSLFCIVSSVRVLFDFAFSDGHCSGVNTCGGVLMNPSQNAGFIVATIPFVVKYFGRKEWNYGSRILVSLAVSAVIVSKSSIAIGLLAVLVFMNALHLKKRWVILMAIPATAAVGIKLLGSNEFFSDGDRLPLWKLLVSAMLLHPVNAIKAWGFGSGLGTIGVLSHSLQELFRFRTQYWWSFAHNDWLEMLLATGLTGALLLLANYANALRRFFVEREMHEVLALIIFGILTLVNPTLHIGWTALFGAWIVCSGLYRDENSQWMWRNLWSGQK